MNEVYQVTEVADKRKRPGFHYSFIQGGWPLGFLLASALALAFLPSLGWRALYLMATIPAAIIVWVISKKLKETPQFELHHKLTQLEKSGQSGDAHALAHAYGVEHSSAAPLKRIWEPHLRRNTIVFSLAWIFNFFGIMIFSILGSSVLKNAKGVELSDAFWMLIVINMLAYFVYVFHGWLGDKIRPQADHHRRLDSLRPVLHHHAQPHRHQPVHDHPHLRRRAVLPGRTLRAAIQYFMAECYPVSCRHRPPHRIRCHEPARHHPGRRTVHRSGGQRGHRRCSPLGRCSRNPVLRLLMIAAKPPAEALLEDHPHEVDADRGHEGGRDYRGRQRNWPRARRSLRQAWRAVGDRHFPGDPHDPEEPLRLVKDAGGQAVIHEVDVRSTPSVDAFAERAVNEFGRLDYAVANAGVLRNSPLGEMTDERWDDMLDVDLTGVLRTCGRDPRR